MYRKRTATEANINIVSNTRPPKKRKLSSVNKVKSKNVSNCNNINAPELQSDVQPKPKKPELHIKELLERINDGYWRGHRVSHNEKKEKIAKIDKMIRKLKRSSNITEMFDDSGRDIFQLLTPFQELTSALKHLLSTQNNINFDHVNSDGQNSAHIACKYGNNMALKIFYKHNGNIILKDGRNLTPLHIAIEPLIEKQFLLKKDANIAILCTKYALLCGQNLFDEINVDSGRNVHFQYCDQSIMDVAMENKYVLNVLYKGYRCCAKMYEEIKKGSVKYDTQVNDDIVDLIWSCTYYPLSKRLLERFKIAQKMNSNNQISGNKVQYNTLKHQKRWRF